MHGNLWFIYVFQRAYCLICRSHCSSYPLPKHICSFDLSESRFCLHVIRQHCRRTCKLPLCVDVFLRFRLQTSYRQRGILFLQLANLATQLFFSLLKPSSWREHYSIVTYLSDKVYVNSERRLPVKVGGITLERIFDGLGHYGVMCVSGVRAMNIRNYEVAKLLARVRWSRRV